MNLRIPSFTILICLLACDCFINTLCSASAKEAQNETVDNTPVVIVSLILEGKTLPGKPKVVAAEDASAVLYEKSGTPIGLKKMGKSTWRCYAVEGEKYVIGWIVKRSWLTKRNKMFGYCSEPFTARDGLAVTFSPGMPATFEYDLSNPPDNIQVFPANVSLLAEIVRNGQNNFLNWGGHQNVIKPSLAKIEGFAGGKYLIIAESCDLQKYARLRTPFLYDRREIEIKSGIVNRIEPIYPEIDTTVEEGDVTIRGTAYSSDKKPLANKAVKLIPYNGEGAMLDLYYPVSITDANGKFEFVGVRPNLGASIECDNASIALGKASLTEKRSLFVDLVVGSGKLSTQIGVPAQDIAIEWEDGGAGKLSDFAGKAVVLYIWTTWCPPCLKALPKLNALAEQMSQKSDIVFITLSIDADRTVWKEKTNKSDWNALRHGWFDPKKNPFTISKRIPFYMIIDENGVVRCEGNDIDIRVQLDKVTKERNQQNIDAKLSN